MTPHTQDNPGVYIPPPLIYAAIFFVAQFLQRKIPIGDTLFHWQFMKIAGLLFGVVALFFIVRSLRQFVQSKNTVITVKGASSLQTKGIYSATRNPMYVGLALIYLGVTCFIGNWWNIILLPLLLLIVQKYVIEREEKYLKRRFGQEYLDYKSRVRRWL